MYAMVFVFLTVCCFIISFCWEFFCHYRKLPTIAGRLMPNTSFTVKHDLLAFSIHAHYE
jgi:hypothetical protein